ncbi:hypothetical protein PR002_g23495 [Phytophthora rubi]|uniref:Uncharacterized protein n=1 Tax=Phytophthora rubi TaxID=129364 RepID=A0A6A3IKF8_9STRA|nr:hypothetical protein PR002_g23495 [Phytophthora rubi]
MRILLLGVSGVSRASTIDSRKTSYSCTDTTSKRHSPSAMKLVTLGVCWKLISHV